MRAASFPQWSRYKWFYVISVGLIIWVLYAYIGPGDDFKRCYTNMVLYPEKLQEVVVRPWTQNPPWLAPFMAPFVTLPGRSGYYVFIAVSIGVVIFGAYFFGGRPLPVLLSAHLFWILWWGQIEAWGVLALVVAWLALKKDSWKIMFFALILASFKPQISFIPVLGLWWMSKNRWKPIVGMFILFGLSILIYGPWPVWYWKSIFNFVGDNHAGPWNASLGLWALPLFIPALLVPMDKYNRVMALAATGYIVSPYMPYYSTIPLLLFNLPWWAYIFAFIGYLTPVWDYAWNSVVLLPVTVLLWIYFPFIKNVFGGKVSIFARNSSQ